MDLHVLFSAIAALAILVYMSPAVLRRPPSVRRYSKPAALSVLGLGIMPGVLLLLSDGHVASHPATP